MSEELSKRIISAIVLALIVLFATWYGGVYFQIVALVIAFAVFYEWSTMTNVASQDLRGYAFGWLSLVVLAANVLFWDNIYGLVILLSCVVIALGICVFQKRSFWLAGGLVYAHLTALSLVEIRGDNLVGLIATLFLFAVVWSTDIAAYFTGRALGGPKLAVRISPGKTWSGAFGGTVAAVAAGCLVVAIYSKDIGWWIPLVALFLSIFSQIGDLFESFIKRKFGVKDSSRLIPGHGGFMDRVDGLVFASFAGFVLWVIYETLMGSSIQPLGAFLLKQW